jgi:protein involved in polysaccharide export with SLBB domain
MMMKFLVQGLALMLGAQCAFSQAADAGPSTNRDARGFLPEAAAFKAPTNEVVAPPAAVQPSVVPTTNSPSVTTTVTSDGTVFGYVTDDKHKLVPGDKLSFQITEDREPQPKSLIVTDSGELDVPYLGRLSVSGKTCKQLGEELKASLEKEYYYRATVMIGLDQASRTLGRVYVWGQVRTQGAIEIPNGENFTAGKAILRAGGFVDFANKKKVKLVRSNPGGQKQTMELNMVAILEDGKTELDVTLQADDFLIVPARLVNW